MRSAGSGKRRIDEAVQIYLRIFTGRGTDQGRAAVRAVLGPLEIDWKSLGKPADAPVGRRPFPTAKIEMPHSRPRALARTAIFGEGDDADLVPALRLEAAALAARGQGDMQQDTAAHRARLLFGDRTRTGKDVDVVLPHFAVTLDPYHLTRTFTVDDGSLLAPSQPAILGFLLLALAMLDQGEILYVPRVRGSQRVVAGRLVPHHDHRVVRIPLALKPRELARHLNKRIGERGPGVPEHLVCGHWQHYGRGENRQRRWKIDYRRGDPSLGTIRHDCAVEADPQE